jgi:hypothetical protein
MKQVNTNAISKNTTRHVPRYSKYTYRLKMPTAIAIYSGIAPQSPKAVTSSSRFLQFGYKLLGPSLALFIQLELFSTSIFKAYVQEIVG